MAVEEPLDQATFTFVSVSDYISAIAAACFLEDGCAVSGTQVCASVTSSYARLATISPGVGAAPEGKQYWQDINDPHHELPLPPSRRIIQAWQSVRVRVTPV